MDTAVWLVKQCCQYRIPEPIRQVTNTSLLSSELSYIFLEVTRVECSLCSFHCFIRYCCLEWHEEHLACTNLFQLSRKGSAFGIQPAWVTAGKRIQLTFRCIMYSKNITTGCQVYSSSCCCCCWYYCCSFSESVSVVITSSPGSPRHLRLKGTSLNYVPC